MEGVLKFIGKIESSLKRLEDCPRQENEDAPPATIVIYPAFAEAMKDIQAGDEILLLTWMHKADREVMTTRPRNDPAAPLTGIFSTRSPDRPNPIGMHYVKVTAVSENEIKLAALEVLDQTPLVDIKPVWKTN
jgi:tRNA-Thr(GGU) m(6)t(6)A37 methyltransferase TsaA